MVYLKCKQMEDKMNILFVCTGNTCRSPMAEALLKKNSNQFKVQSAGISASHGSQMSQGSKEVLKVAGIKFDHQAQQVTAELIDWADIVLTMTHSHKQLLNQMFPSNQGDFYTIKEYNKEENERALKQYRLALKELKEKQNTFKEPNEGFETELEKELAITKYVKKELAKVEKLKAKIYEEDVQDPFGQNKAIYQATYDELYSEINKLITT